MNELFQNQYAPDVVSAPGETLAEVLLMRYMSQAELAERTGRPKKTINEIIQGKAAITAETALQFEKVLGIPAAFWMAREQNYREALARNREREVLSRESDWLEQVPYRAMAALGWIGLYKDKTVQLEALLKFFGVASPASWSGMWKDHPAFRHSPTFKSEPGALAAWLRKGELVASGQIGPEFSSAAFKDALSRIKALTRQLPENFASTLVNECAAAGVCVVFVPELPGTHVWGVTRWLSSTRALIQLSLRYKTDDHFWFTFFHEAGHILLHGRKEVFLEEEDNKSANDKEKEANIFARDWLIPENRYKIFQRKGSYSCAAISRFAHELGIAPGIVVGRLQHDHLIKHFECNDLKKPLSWSLI